MIAIIKKNSTTNISEHLSHDEFKCHCQEPFCLHTKIDYRLGVMFEELRKKCGDVPIKVNSGYRCEYNNFSCGGSPTSFHMLGQALDCVPPWHITLDSFKEIANEVGFTFTYINRDKNFCHMDIRGN